MMDAHLKIIILLFIFSTNMAYDEFTKCETKVRLDGKVALVTGATSGLGFEVAKDFSRRGARVIITGRNSKKTADAKNKIIATSRNTNIRTGYLDYESLATVRSFAYEIISTEPRLDILVNNAGALGLEDKLTVDGLQITMQVNYLGQFLLTFLLFPLLKASAPSRIVNVASMAIYLGYIDVDHFNDIGRYNMISSYSNSKLAILLSTVEMDKRVRGSGVNLYSLDPGAINSNIFGSLKNDFFRSILNTGMSIFGNSPQRVSRLPVYLAVDQKFDKSSGKHYRDCEEYYSSWFVNDTVLREKLWKKSKQLVGITSDEDWESNSYRGK